MTVGQSQALNTKASRAIGSRRRILIVDDDPLICRLLQRFLSSEGYHVASAADGAAMWRKLQKWPSDLVVLDLKLRGGEDGLDLARELHESFDVALIILTGKSESVDKIVGLELGADDYVTKPFEPRELLARIRSVLRRFPKHPTILETPDHGDGKIRFADWTLDLAERKLTSLAGVQVELTSSEFELLSILVSRPGRPQSRDQILEQTANRRWDPIDRSIDVMIGKLRRKLNDNSRAPRLIKTVRGIGYVFTSPTCVN